MTLLLEDSLTLSAPRDRVWSVVDDPAALQRVLPGCEELVPEGPGRYRATMRTRLQFMTLRMQGTAELQDVRRPDHLRLEISGRPVGLVGSFVVSVPVDLTETGAVTSARYSVDLRLTGRLAAFGLPILRSTVKGQVRELVANLERELVAEAPQGDEKAP